MNLVDYLILAVLIGSALGGLRRGLIRTVFQVVGLIAALVAGYVYAPALAARFTGLESVLAQWFARTLRLPALGGPGASSPFSGFILPEAYQQGLRAHQGLSGTFSAGVGESLAHLVMVALAFLVIVLVVRAAFTLVGALLRTVAVGPFALGDRLAGACFGALQAAVLLGLQFTLIWPFLALDWLQPVGGYIARSPLAAWLTNALVGAGSLFR